MNPKLPLDGRIYTLTVGRVLNIIVFQINLGELLFTATLRVRLGSCLSTALKMDNLDCTKINAHFKKIHSLSTGGPHSLPLVHIASPTSPPYVGTQLTALFHTQPPLKCPFYGIAAQTVKLRILVKAQPAPQAPGHCHQLGLAYGHETCMVYPTNTLSATVAFLLLPDTNLLPQAGITHYSQLLTRQHSTKRLLVFLFSFFF